MVKALVDNIKVRFTEAISTKQDKALEVTQIMQQYDNAKVRKVEEGAVLTFGDKVTLKRRVGRHQVKGVITAVHVNDFDDTVTYDVVPTQGATHMGVSEFDLVKSAEGTRAFQNSTDINNLNDCAERKHVQYIRLNNIESLGKECDDSKRALTNSEINLQLIQQELASFGPITLDEWILYGKELIKPGLDYAKQYPLMWMLKTQEEEHLQSIKD